MIQKWLEAFHTVATTGGFTRAAEALNVGQPTISTHVKSLEEYFHVELFHRHGRTVKLTSTGRALVTITRGMYGHQNEAIALLNAAQNLQSGELRLNAVGPFDVMEVLGVFRRSYPKIITKVTLSSEAEILKGLRDFDYDIGVLGRAVDDPIFHCEFYNQHRIMVIVNSQHRLAKRRNIPLEELQNCDMVLRPPFSTTRQVFERALAEAGVSINPIMEMNSREAVREAVSRGFGIGVVSETELAPAANIHTLRVTNAQMFTKAFMVSLAERRDRPLIDAYFCTAAAIDPKRRGSV